jgi:hypothetical protein
MEHFLSLYLRDELLALDETMSTTLLLEKVNKNVELVLQRALILSNNNANHPEEGVYQTILNLIATSVNPHNLANMNIGWNPWF